MYMEDKRSRLSNLENFAQAALGHVHLQFIGSGDKSQMRHQRFGYNEICMGTNIIQGISQVSDESFTFHPTIYKSQTTLVNASTLKEGFRN